MIRVKRTPAPEFFHSKTYEQLKNSLTAGFTEVTKKKRQSGYEWGDQEAIVLKAAGNELMEMFRGKCAYCESRVEFESQSELGHYRPRRGARGLSDAEGEGESGAYYDTHYWWLSLEWDNLLLLCRQCQRFKGSWFPLMSEARRAALPGKEGPGIDEEEPLLLDPCADDTRLHLRFRADGTVEPLSRRGKVTIDLISLNRSELVAARENAADETRKLMEVAFTEAGAVGALREILAPDSALPYLAVRRSLIAEAAEGDKHIGGVVEDWLAEQGIASDFIAVPKQAPAAEPQFEALATEPALDIGRLALEKIELHNFRNIADLSIDVPSTSEAGRAPWLLFLGENAVGKSTILQAIVLTLMGEGRVEATGIGPDDVLRYYREDGELKRCEEGYVRIWVSGRPEPLELRFELGDSEFRGNVATPSTYLLAYGPTRLLPDPEHRTVESPGRVRVHNLFQPFIPLTDVSRWLYDFWKKDEDRHEEENTPYNLTVRGLRQMLLMKDDESIEPDRLEPEKRRILIELKNETTTLDNLSDGYRTILALAADLMFMLHREGTSMEEAEGIVIIDEIGSNLHPGWKKRIVSSFRNVFPKIQFVVTTHEPLCLRGMYERETVLLRRDYEEQIVAVTNLPNPNDLRVDELLVSEFFGLSSTVESDVEEIFAEYYKLLTVPRPTKAQRARIAELKEQLREREHLGHGLRDELMYEVIDKLIAEHMRSRHPKRRSDLKKEAVDKVLQAWQQSGFYDDYMPESDS